MSIVYKVPLTPVPQEFSIVLGTVEYRMLLAWNTMSETWILDISDVSGNLIVGGIPLITGANLFEQYDYLNFGGVLLAKTDNDASAVPTYENLGSDSNLYFVVP